jgi:class 3 adenylate cyclase
MDIHSVEGATPGDLAKAHAADLMVQSQHGCECLKYWFNEKTGKVFCLIQAPSVEAANAVHRDAHGLLAEKIIEVDPELAEGFLGCGDVNAAGAVVLPSDPNARDPGIRSVLFTDIVGSTEMTQRIGDEAAMAVLEVHDGIVRDALSAVGGREVKHTGDGIMASFISAVSAVRCATQIQHALAEHRNGNGNSSIKVRIGAAAGEPVEQRHDLFGSTVQLAARLCAHAQPSQVLVSNVVAELCIGKGLHFDDLGEAHLKGFDHPVRVHAVQLAS